MQAENTGGICWIVPTNVFKTSSTSSRVICSVGYTASISFSKSKDGVVSPNFNVARIHSTLPETPIIILSAVFDKEIVEKTIEIGVSGYIPKTSSNAVILSAVNLVMSGGVYIPPELLNRKLPDEFNEFRQAVELPEGKAVEENIKSLTPRQIDVLRCISQGMSNKQIAYALGLTEGTVKLHVTAILKILNVYNRTGAVVEASRLGLIKKND